MSPGGPWGTRDLQIDGIPLLNPGRSLTALGVCFKGAISRGGTCNSEPPISQYSAYASPCILLVRTFLETLFKGVLAMVSGERTSSAEDYVLTSFLQCLLHDPTHMACHDVLQNYEAKSSHLPEASP